MENDVKNQNIYNNSEKIYPIYIYFQLNEAAPSNSFPAWITPIVILRIIFLQKKDFSELNIFVKLKPCATTKRGLIDGLNWYKLKPK